VDLICTRLISYEILFMFMSYFALLLWKSTRVVWKVRAKSERWHHWCVLKLFSVSSISLKNTHQISARSVYFSVFGVRLNHGLLGLGHSLPPLQIFSRNQAIASTLSRERCNRMGWSAREIAIDSCSAQSHVQINYLKLWLNEITPMHYSYKNSNS